MAERTCKIGHEIIPIPGSDANYWYVSVVNHYDRPGDGGPMVELENRLRINDEFGGPVVDVPLTRQACLELARMFLAAAMHDSWGKIAAGRARTEATDG